MFEGFSVNRTNELIVKREKIDKIIDDLKDERGKIYKIFDALESLFNEINEANLSEKVMNLFVDLLNQMQKEIEKKTIKRRR